jgi:hypothetical protein
VQVFTVFWGPEWSGELADLPDELNGFFDFVVASALIDQLDEYSVPDSPIQHGTRFGTATIADAPPAALTDDDLRNALHTWLRTDPGFPQPGPNVLYFIYLPPNVAIAMGEGRSCREFCGYHDAIAESVFYAVLPYPGCSGCAGGLSPLDALTSTSSHELAEAITDPLPGTGWYDDTYGEIGDICAWQTKRLDGYMVQLEWSNATQSCQHQDIAVEVVHRREAYPALDRAGVAVEANIVAALEVRPRLVDVADVEREDGAATRRRHALDLREPDSHRQDRGLQLRPAVLRHVVDDRKAEDVRVPVERPRQVGHA